LTNEKQTHCSFDVIQLKSNNKFLRFDLIKIPINSFLLNKQSWVLTKIIKPLCQVPIISFVLNFFYNIMINHKKN